MDRRDWLAGSAAMLAATSLQQPRAKVVAGVAKTLRVAFNTAETGFDPVQISDFNSSTVVSSISSRRWRTTTSPGR